MLRKVEAQMTPTEDLDRYDPRLIAAAPALLNACRAILEDLENNGEIFGTDEKRMYVLRNAIEDATGVRE